MKILVYRCIPAFICPINFVEVGPFNYGDVAEVEDKVAELIVRKKHAFTFGDPKAKLHSGEINRSQVTTGPDWVSTTLVIDNIEYQYFGKLLMSSSENVFFKFTYLPFSNIFQIQAIEKFKPSELDTSKVAKRYSHA